MSKGLYYESMVNIANCNKILLSVKIGALACLLTQETALAQTRFFAAPHLPAAIYQEFQKYLQQHPVTQHPIPKGSYSVYRLLDYQRKHTERSYWLQQRLDEQQEYFSVKIRVEIWREAELLWQTTVQVRRNLKYLSDEVKGAGQSLLPAYLSQEAGLLHFPALSGTEEAMIRQGLFKQAADRLEQDIQHYILNMHDLGESL